MATSISKLRPGKYSKISNGADSNEHPSEQSNGAYGADSGSSSESDLPDSFPSTANSSWAYNDTHLTQGLVRDMIERLKIGITFLLDDRSPIYNPERGDQKQSVSLDDMDHVDDEKLESKAPNSMTI